VPLSQRRPDSHGDDDAAAAAAIERWNGHRWKYISRDDVTVAADSWGVGSDQAPLLAPHTPPQVRETGPRILWVVVGVVSERRIAHGRVNGSRKWILEIGAQRHYYYVL
jgi:hypothetical protein